jgi:hypothetical protein
VITEELRKYIDLVKFEEENDLLHEMANVHPKQHGIQNVVIQVGSVVGVNHGLRIKVSNVPGTYDRKNNFVIKMPSLDYDINQAARWIDVEKIKDWIKLNQKLLYDYEEGIIDDTEYFLNNISKV